MSNTKPQTHQELTALELASVSGGWGWVVGVALGAAYFVYNQGKQDGSSAANRQNRLDAHMCKAP